MTKLRRCVTVFLLVLSTLFGLQWIRSRWWTGVVNLTRAEGLPYRSRYLCIILASGDSIFDFRLERMPTPAEGRYRTDGWFLKERLNRRYPPGSMGPTSYMGFAFRHQIYNASNGEVNCWLIRAPWWFLSFLLLGVTGIWARTDLHASRARRRLRSGECVVCGYDLRASPDRCPECGTKVVGDGRSSQTPRPVEWS